MFSLHPSMQSVGFLIDKMILHVMRAEFLSVHRAILYHATFDVRLSTFN